MKIRLLIVFTVIAIVMVALPAVAQQPEQPVEKQPKRQSLSVRVERGDLSAPPPIQKKTEGLFYGWCNTSFEGNSCWSEDAPYELVFFDPYYSLDWNYYLFGGADPENYQVIWQWADLTGSGQLIAQFCLMGWDVDQGTCYADFLLWNETDPDPVMSVSWNSDELANSKEGWFCEIISLGYWYSGWHAIEFVFNSPGSYDGIYVDNMIVFEYSLGQQMYKVYMPLLLK